MAEKKLGFALKPIIIVVITLLFLIPLSFIRSLVFDRQVYRDDAVDSIMEPFGGSPKFEGLAIAVPYIEVQQKGAVTVVQDTHYIVMVPDYYSLDIEVEPYYLSRGIFSVPVFNGDVSVQASFAPFSYRQFDISEEKIKFNKAILLFGVEDKKNLTKFPHFAADGRGLKESLTEVQSASPFTSTVYYELPEDFLTDGFSLQGEFTIQGGKSINLTPLATDNRFTMKSSWASPSFSGGWLPSDREVEKNGFTAEWNVPGLTTVFPHSWLSNKQDKLYAAESVQTSFMIPVDSYKKTERSVKYGILFLIVPFLAIFLCELFSHTRIHPIQYALMGLADVLFYLLLLSISEHISFGLSYLITAAAVCITTLFYATAIFKRLIWGALLSLVQIVSYILLFGILQSEDYAFLIGSIGLFLVVVLLMVLTRKVDWYSHGMGDLHRKQQNSLAANPELLAQGTASSAEKSDYFRSDLGDFVNNIKKS